VEIVLHDTSNPLRSIKALQNPISGRHLNDPTTNFGVELIRYYAKVTLGRASFISYPLKLKDGRSVKATTIPLYDERIGLYGFVCINIDISQLTEDAKKAEVSRDLRKFLDSFTRTRDSQDIKDIKENLQRSQSNAPNSLRFVEPNLGGIGDLVPPRIIGIG